MRWNLHLGCAAATLGLLLAVVCGQSAAEELQFAFKGTNACLQCHRESGAQTPENYPRDFILLNESSVFIAHDKHSRAFELLDGELGRRICNNMHVNLGNPKDVNAKKCLACHADLRHDPPPQDGALEMGVSCEACHGPSSAWDQPHRDRNWRTRPPAEKFKDYGMIDVRNPVTRAAQCLSCHVGDAAQGKVVTHEMYAAGHPPRPGIEVEAFSRQMPVHWRTLREKGDFEHRAKYVELNFPGKPEQVESDLPHTRAMLVGGVMALRQSVGLLGDSAKAQNWPEFSMFDCGACHHELKTPSWRQIRPTIGARGRPMVPAWPTALVRVSMQHVADERDSGEFKKLLGNFVRDVAARPFGAPEQIAVSAASLQSFLDDLALRVSRTPCDRDAALRALKSLLDTREAETLDFHSARQVAWAISDILVELGASHPKFEVHDPSETAISLATLRQRGRADAAAYELWRRDGWQKSLGKVDRQMESSQLQMLLSLKLPTGPEGSIAKNQVGSLGAIADYKPEAFRKALEDLRKQLQADGTLPK